LQARRGLAESEQRCKRSLYSQRRCEEKPQKKVYVETRYAYYFDARRDRWVRYAFTVDAKEKS
jgi:hypothetical protein